MEDIKKGLVVVAIQNGTVIDQIPPDKLFKVVSILNLDTLETQITVGNNLKSNKIGTKGIIKISDKFFDPNVINKIALIAPNAKLNIIKDYQVIEKRNVDLPDKIHNIIHCANPKCITNNEPVPTLFHVIDKENIKVKCNYCEHSILQEDITMK
ncbi:MAG: aspartate carbamoyltransferase regulatory subunit [Paludibacteraceae bacterium]|nr:aspartate carbamoyltransferase regulatory subunit [Paludibacteraceae bacterium]MBN2788241.1 aspartate carbamoyltransferase regulatory subunit [Paludibacteraceae bacterium]